MATRRRQHPFNSPRARTPMNAEPKPDLIRAERVPLRLDLAGHSFSDHSLTHRTEIAIRFSPWG
jgi:hypothetical protein